ncbi:Lrp/AsnC family transcriptional regulator [Bradyrhizobium japonicum]|uniref:Lrp/AsnC family transcriptional regulator n=1 Tax=Bradyrhizobium japonicum TaxID=375 RepID=UPI00057E7461|nr:Lrp/AsnC family transcriptional regulator [Bradyrhizobium japonicum]MBR0912531.1 Lrp/AsnC family transcriptional regulator [Bradyrhizobium japonicum]MCD9109453.1 Lrp/AsnC family transcriptional regulator [Bradyrhizobium japonicum]MCD9257129.1 Lrp/AsnC family transcriptional regulator [Bradyrhizobium japonicum SEMIA 5079]MCD9821639.1 Lrp/AsnC family transcriptional regulator [Bradyrhizobium japonicum]MCD9896502.1 Lrp/AsnC family transcriptional regulator [Bradyrhizobium japonicum]
MNKLDEFDIKILSALQDNARISTQELAERVGLSATPCARRVKRMEDDGLIDRYVTLLNPERLGIGLNVFVNVRLNTQSAKAFEAFEQAIRKLPQVVGCYLLAGNYDYLVQIRVADVEAFRSFIRDRLVTIEGIGETQSNVVLEETKRTTALPLVS